MVGRQGGWSSWGHRVARGVRSQWGVEGENGVWDDIVTLWRWLLRGRSIAVGVRTGRGGLVVQGARKWAVCRRKAEKLVKMTEIHPLSCSFLTE